VCRTAIDKPGVATGETCEGIVVGTVDPLTSLIEPQEQLSQAHIAIRRDCQSTWATGTREPGLAQNLQVRCSRPEELST
jgi:hypothetical protein